MIYVFKEVPRRAALCRAEAALDADEQRLLRNMMRRVERLAQAAAEVGRAFCLFCFAVAALNYEQVMHAVCCPCVSYLWCCNCAPATSLLRRVFHQVPCLLLGLDAPCRRTCDCWWMQSTPTSSPP